MAPAQQEYVSAEITRRLALFHDASTATFTAILQGAVPESKALVTRQFVIEKTEISVASEALEARITATIGATIRDWANSYHRRRASCPFPCPSLCPACPCTDKNCPCLDLGPWRWDLRICHHPCLCMIPWCGPCRGSFRRRVLQACFRRPGALVKASADGPSQSSSSNPTAAAELLVARCP